ncbi:uncharacterized protein ACA1_269310 [Acanthamoeba castellanii str. Neff]|uniref:RING-type domain-containing protein n=1 Tax=Acanthamoeba castellanii (strain ATCC 30010 / Neff) TaxID=1257118 RepID=L8H2R5_ACACF|nr:uncharacterized protein ACA1_269310 [Acanthamoeba castellanii str. Neff]ELR19510.1 hypothetical protein ACA1_269310 [Acanthamoeba castellanii str. Neff]
MEGEHNKAEAAQKVEEEQRAGEEEQPQRECAVCLEKFGADALLSSHACDHALCKTCWEKYLATEFDEKRKGFLDIVCPYPKCGQRLSDEDWRKCASAKTLENYEAVWKTVPEKATCFQDFNYAYDDHGVLRNTINGDKFHWVNQMHYDALGDFIVEHIQNLLKKEHNMEEVILPLDVDNPDVPRTNIFLTPGALQAEKLILLIQGSGAVRPGQWARALCINDSLEVGTIFPYLRKCAERGWGVVVFNPNQNAGTKPGADDDEAWFKTREAFLSTAKVMRPIKHLIKIPGSETPSKHTTYVWDHFCAKAAASRVAIIAHSAGGICTMDLLRERGEEVMPRCVGVAFTDSVHWVSGRDPVPVRQFIKKNAVNWVKSNKPLDAPERGSGEDGCPCVSAGHPKHEWTSGCCVESVFKFLDDKFEAAQQ